MRILALLCVIALAVPATALFADGLYVSMGAGGLLVADSKKVGGETKFGDDKPVKLSAEVRPDLYYDLGFAFAAAIGYDFGAIRVDTEISYLSASGDIGGGDIKEEDAKKFDDGGFRSFGATANAWYDINTRTAWTPYIGGGVGGMNIGIPINFLSGWAFTYQAGAGVIYQLNETASFNFGYRLLGAIRPKITRTDEYKDEDGKTIKDTVTLTPSILTHRVTLGVTVAL